MAAYIHGGSDEREAARLEKQARFVAPSFQQHLRARPGDRILDLATGVGAMAGELVRRFPETRVVGLDLRRAQLCYARRNHPEAAYAQGDGARMPFAGGTFDHVHCSWLLEHVPRPVEILREVHRVLRPGGEALFIEVDNSSFDPRPPDPEILAVMREMDAAQLRGGGDPYVGQKLRGYFEQAGFSKVEVMPSRMYGDEGNPAAFREVVEEFAEIFESLDEALGPRMLPRLRAAAARLRELPSIPGASMSYRSFIARGTK